MSNAETTLNSVTHVKEHSSWFIALGVIFIVGGVFAIAMPYLASLAVTIAVGASLLFVGILQLIHSWSIRTWGGFALQALIGVIILIGGAAILYDPIVAALSLTLLLGIVFVAKGIAQLVLGLRYRPHANWGWIVAAGVVAIVLGVLIVMQWPWSSIWVLGTLAGISLIFSGWSYIMIALAARKI
jgi:uncharacterized membrane protein HdeD (DUF308 family)